MDDKNSDDSTKSIISEELVLKKWNLQRVEVSYTIDLMELWTTYDLFYKGILPKIKEKNPDKSEEGLIELIKAMWQKFKDINPFIEDSEEKKDSADVSENEKDTTSNNTRKHSRIKVVPRQQSARPVRSTRKSSKWSTVDMSSEEDFLENSDSDDWKPKKSGISNKRKFPTLSLSNKKKRTEDMTLSEEELEEEEEIPIECKICKADDGNLFTCDSCDTYYHLTCIDPELEEHPTSWNCPECVSKGVKKKAKQNKCRQCQTFGLDPFKSTSSDLFPRSLIECSTCTNFYHYHCMVPESRPVKKYAIKNWRCPMCLCKRPKFDSVSCLNWRYKSGYSETSLGYRPIEILVLPKRKSYWEVKWVSHEALQLITNRGVIHNFFKRHPPFDMETEEGVRSNRHKNDRDKDIYERFTRWGLPEEYLVPDRVIECESVDDETRYLVKWGCLDHGSSTWETVKGRPEVDLTPIINSYEKRVQHFQKEWTPISHEEMNRIVPYTEQPSYIPGVLHSYQLEGLNWLRHSYYNGLNTILADEMGLGKTIQTLAFLYSLFKEGICNGPFLITVPLSTLTNWERECQFWCPDFYYVSYYGEKDSRPICRQYEFYQRSSKLRRDVPKFHIMFTPYQFISIDKRYLMPFKWEAIVVDEAHRLKNQGSIFYKDLMEYNVKYKLLLTGTPLQNSLDELFTILKYLEPNKFVDIEDFMSNFADISQDDKVKKLHDLLKMHLLRRVKADVFKSIPAKAEMIVRVELTALQKRYYKNILTKNISALRTKSGKVTSLNNILMELRKCVNHPFLIPAAVEETAKFLPNGNYEGHSLVESSGKLALLERMLPKLVKNGHRVLFFSQFVIVLDLFEDFFDYLKMPYERIDGNIRGVDRQRAIDRFNAEESNTPIFLLSTKAGGLGINLATADTIILHDSDWNPHNDIQALSRAHRIGQTKKVVVYRLVAHNTIEERMVQVAKEKLLLTNIFIGSAGSKGTGSPSLSKQELEDLIKFGTDDLFKNSKDDEKSGEIVYDDETLNKILDRSQIVSDEPKVGLDDYFSAFNVADYEVQKTDKTKQPNEAVEKNDPQYWEKILGVSPATLELGDIEYDPNLGKGKRQRRRVDYTQAGLSFAGMEEAADHPGEMKKKFDGYETANLPPGKLPPLKQYTRGCLHILGLTPRERRIVQAAIMKYGLPQSNFTAPWKQRELCRHPDHVIQAYIKLYLSHLCQSKNKSAKKYSDGLPKEGCLPSHVLTRIGMLSLIRHKVEQFEATNGNTTLNQMNLLIKNYNLPGQFEFNILDGGLTELHTIWRHEMHSICLSPSSTIGSTLWNLRHDYWFLVGVVSHGYGAFSDIISDPRFSILKKPFETQFMQNSTDVCITFMQRRLRILEQALFLEEHLRRVACLCCEELQLELTAENISLKHKQLHAGLLSMGHKKQIRIADQESDLYIALTKFEDYLMDLYYDLTRVPTSIVLLDSNSPDVSKAFDPLDSENKHSGQFMALPFGGKPGVNNSGPPTVITIN